jgi:PilZ domain-containing protein
MVVKQDYERDAFKNIQRRVRKVASKQKTMLADDRRRFFRIEDEINLYYKRVDEELLKVNNHGSEDILGHCSLSAALDMLSQEAQLTLRRLERNEPDVADYLKVLENKIDLIARAVLMQGMDLSEQKTRNVNMSASGIAFECEEAMQAGECLEIKMLLASSMTVIATYGKVIHCKHKADDDSEYPFLVGVDYYNMKDQDKELLIKHVVKRQMQQIREFKEEE